MPSSALLTSVPPVGAKGLLLCTSKRPCKQGSVCQRAALLQKTPCD